jgi:glutathionyl-hydroquinone reductase
VLWDKRNQTIVNNESADIIRMLNSSFGKLGNNDLDLYPPDLRAEINALNEPIYRKLNNGVYRAGFATTQHAYEEAFWGVFEMIDELEQRLDGRSFLFGDRLTETDIRLFVTLVRFDAAYHGLFKCNLRRLIDYPNLIAYLRRIMTIQGVQETVNVEHIKQGYYSIKALNPTGIVPLGPKRPLPG